MTEVNLIINKPEEMKTLIFQRREEYNLKGQKEERDQFNCNSKPPSSVELTNYLSVTQSTINSWAKKGLLNNTIHRHALLSAKQTPDMVMNFSSHLVNSLTNHLANKQNLPSAGDIFLYFYSD